jgi:hypothetical protein
MAAVLAGGVMGCTSGTKRPDLTEFKVGDCLKLGGTPDRPEAVNAECGGPGSNFKVVAIGPGAAAEACPPDVDSSYSTRNSITGSNNTVCLDIDWVIGGCMSVDPQHTTDPFRVDCNDTSVPNRQRAIQILKNLDPPVSIDQCSTGLGYTYPQRRFAVCVEAISSAPRT